MSVLIGEKSKANLRAVRELLGLSVSEVADMFGVNQTTVTRWERPDSPMEPPDDVWEGLVGELAAQDERVGAAVDAVVDMACQTGAQDRMAVKLPYYRTQSDLDDNGRDDGYVGLVNGDARRVALRLGELGFKVEFRYPCDPDPALDQARRLTR